ncbi:MAG: hypothetical protein Q8R81_09415 [Novosphingobium sp.]|uniref:hypothetical protein n=1 Tax=Novosphingobium sp. TaxID=1874826 RepID=UPI002733ECF2|nr:hypothetical protein [Novosphingobium sp.]MDP3550602.1 hypothetical protein [Novosphingobium sp.]
MAKALKVIGTIAAGVALVATGVGAFAAAGTALASTAASVATYAGLAASVAAVGANVLQKAPPARGSVTQTLVAVDPPRPLVMGEGYVGGVLRYRRSYGGTVGKVPNPYRWLVEVYSGCGPIDSITPYVAYAPIDSWYSGFLFTDTQLGACPEASALTPHFSGAPGWDSNSKLSGFPAIGWNQFFDKDGNRFASGEIVRGAYGKWTWCYDPRLDSTRSGGSGSHRLNDSDTWGWSNRAALFAGTYAHGWYQNGELVMGMGLPDEAIDWVAVADWANVCEDNGWTIFGRLFEPGDANLRWQNLIDICIAGGGQPVFAGGQLSFHYWAPRISLGTITEKALAEGTRRITAMKGYAQRINAIVPKFTDPGSNWEQVAAEEVIASALVTEDGEKKTEEFPYNLVKDVNQAAELAMYRIYAARELSVPELPLLPGYEFIRPGECWTFDLPDMGLEEQDCIVWTRTSDPATFGTKLALETETAAKHPFCLGQTGVAPPTPTIGLTAQERDELAAAAILPPAYAQQAISISYVSDADPLDGLLQATDDEITIESFVRTYQGLGDVSITGATLTTEDDGTTALAPETLYHVYYDDPTLADTTPAFKATQTSTVAANSNTNPYRHYLGTVTTDVTGGTGTSGGGAVPPGWGGGDWNYQIP